ncbi:MAG: hypothetical protein ACYC1K_01050 [Minisyncoccota bacterium]
MFSALISNIVSFFHGELFALMLHYAWVLAPIWFTLALILTWLDLWLTYKRREWIKAQGSVLLEIKIPREMFKSPLAMEMFLNSLYGAGVGNLMDVYLKGRVRTWFSLEIISIDGQVRFLIWGHKNMKSRIEAQLYAQFPNVSVQEVADYTLGIHRNPEKITFGWFGQFALTKADAYPIKTYIDYGLDKDAKEEYKHDPIVPMLEFLGSLKKGEQAWIQILIQSHSKEGLKYGRVFTKPDWKSDIEKEIKAIVKKATIKTEDQKNPTSLNLSKGQAEVIAAMERTASKYAFDTMIRATYFAENDVYNPANIGGLLGSFAQFNSQTLNGFKPNFTAGVDYVWQDFRGANKKNNEEKLLEAYKRRAFFNTPFKHFHGKPFILTTEELATVFHFPSYVVAATPTLSRIPSKRAEAPSNLPI